MQKRSSGILMHISSLPGRYGIGDFGREAYRFVDFLVESGQGNWQILPLGVTGYGDSPYQNFSAFAGNPYFIDLDEFLTKGYLTEKDIEKEDLGSDPLSVDYGKLHEGKNRLLRKAYMNSAGVLKEELEGFMKEQGEWLRDYALFMSIKTVNGGKSWFGWDEELRDFTSRKVQEFEKANSVEIYFHVFLQYFFFKQWKALKAYANNHGVRIIGDIPIYVAEDSSDLWANPRFFNLDRKLNPKTVAGCPPDAFSATGQLWGNPIYDWDALEKDGYSFWIERIKASLDLYDSVRIDHFRGFEAYWEIKYGSLDAVKGEWTKGPGMKLFTKIREELGEMDIIAEDLGFLTEEVFQLIRDTGFPGMKVLQFAFDSRESNDYLPHTYDKNCVVYTGTHDNETSQEWMDTVKRDDFNQAVRYLKLNYDEGLVWGFIRGAWSSVANLAIAPMQDFLCLGKEARMNKPSTIGGNWTWRVDKDEMNSCLSRKIRELTKRYGR